MKLKIYQVDAFAEKVFTGNPAAICPLEEWIEEETMQKIAQENNVSETAFFVWNEDHYDIRWFAPEAEIELCGHATLASAYVIFNYLNFKEEVIKFTCGVGDLFVKREGELFVMEFPSNPAKPIDEPEGLSEALGAKPDIVMKSSHCMAIFDDEEIIKKMSPDFTLLKKVDQPVFIVTAPGKNYDFVSRVFGPIVGIDEDPVTGSAHTLLIPYWSERLGKKKLFARQVSKRGGELKCEMKKETVIIAGKAAPYLIGEISI